MKEITKFANVAGTPSGLSNQLDTVGSSIDLIFADAIVAYEPTTVLEEAGIIVVKQVADPTDKLSFPIVRNTQLTWTTIDGRTGSNALGSELNTTGMRSVEYKEVRPTVKTASIFLPDEVSLLNKVDFNLYSQLIATDAKRKKEVDALTALVTETAHVNVFAAGGMVSNGSLTTGSTLSPADLLTSRTKLRLGSDPVDPDFVLVHAAQYEQLSKHAAFAPGATSPGAMMRKAQFDQNGDLVRFSGMDIYWTELLPGVTGSATTAYPASVNGHPAIVGKKGWAIGRGEKKGITVYSQDDRIRHGTYKVIDMSYDQTVLVKESMVLIRCAD
jgi:hypothetical protein